MFDPAIYEPAPLRAPACTLDSLRGGGIWAQDTTGGKALLTLDPIEPTCGGELGGFVDLAIPFDENAQFRVVLGCELSETISDSDGDKSERKTALWLEAGLGAAEPGPTGTCVKFRFVLPPSTRPSGKHDQKYPDDRVTWQLHVQTLDREQYWTWDVLIRAQRTATGGQSPFGSSSQSVSDVPETGKSRASPLPTYSLRRRPNPDWLALIEVFKEERVGSMSKHALIGLGITCFGLFFPIVAWFNSQGLVLIIPFVLGALFIAIGAYWGGSVVYMAGALNEYVFMQDALVVRRTWFGWQFQKRTVTSESITDIVVNEHLSAPGYMYFGLPEHLSKWSLSVSVTGGKPVSLMGGLEESAQAHVLRRWIALILKQGVSGVHLEGELPLEAFFPT